MFKPTLEVLNARLVPAGITFSAGVITVTGTEFNDECRVTLESATNEILIDTTTLGDHRFDRDAVNKIVFHGGDGHDKFINGTSIDCVLNGGNGNDTLQGGSGWDTLSGGNDADTLHGMRGNDSMDGGKGNDFLAGWNHDDTLKGGSGTDTLWGGSGNDRLDGGFDYRRDILLGETGFDIYVQHRYRDWNYPGPRTWETQSNEGFNSAEDRMEFKDHTIWPWS